MTYLGLLHVMLIAALASANARTGVPELQPRQTTSGCASLHIIVARASTESQTYGTPPGEGIIGQVATNICKEVSGCDSYGIVYPATLSNYFSSEANGTAAMMSAIRSYYTRCPSTPLVLLGYSQGAQVVGDVLCGTSEAGWTSTAPINGSVTNNIIAAIQMGDPSHVTGLSWNVGTATKNGVLPRRNPSACDPFASRLQAYCDANDKYCASGSSELVHTSYVGEYGAAAAKFVISKYSAYNSSTQTGTKTSAAMSSTLSFWGLFSLFWGVTCLSYIT